MSQISLSVPLQTPSVASFTLSVLLFILAKLDIVSFSRSKGTSETSPSVTTPQSRAIFAPYALATTSYVCFGIWPSLRPHLLSSSLWKELIFSSCSFVLPRQILTPRFLGYYVTPSFLTFNKLPTNFFSPPSSGATLPFSPFCFHHLCNFSSYLLSSIFNDHHTHEFYAIKALRYASLHKHSTVQLPGTSHTPPHSFTRPETAHMVRAYTRPNNHFATTNDHLYS